MDFALILIIFVVFLFSLTVFYKPKRLPPGPISLPLIGSYFLLRQMRMKKPYVVLFEASKEYGNIFSFRIGPQLVVVLNGYDAIHEALVKQADAFSDRPEFLSVIQRQFKNGVVKGILFQGYNRQHKMLRRFTLRTLRDFGVGKSSLEEKIRVEIEAATDVITVEDGKPLKLANVLQKIVANVILGIVFAKRFEYDDPELSMICRISSTVFSGRGQISVENFFPLWLTRLFSRKDNMVEQIRLKTLKDAELLISEQIKEHEKTYNASSIRDFVDLYIQVSRQSKEGASEIYTKENIFRVILELFLAGSETTASTLDWAFLFMSENPDIQDKCHREIDAKVGAKVIEYNDRAKLQYIDATISEVLRHANIVPLALPHCTKEDTILLGYHIPKETVITPCLYSASMDLKYWKEPQKFNPDRFLNDNGEKITHEALIPFSTGPRTCLGEPLARMELFLIFANLLQRFTFTRENTNIKHSMASKPNQHTIAPYPYRIRIKRR